MAQETSNSLTLWLVNSVRKLNYTEIDSVNQWLEDLRQSTEMECMCVLQGKSLAHDTSDIVITMAKSNKDSLDTIKGKAHVISHEFTKLFRKLEKERWRHVKSGALKITCQIRSLLHECNSIITDPPQGFLQQQQVVMGECAKFSLYVESNIEAPGKEPQKFEVLQLMTVLGQAFSTMVDIALGYLIQQMLSLLQDPECPYTVKSTLSNIVSLGLEGEHMCYLIAREGAVECLLDMCSDSRFIECHSLALRAIATICCVPESIQQLGAAGGVETLTDILSNSTEEGVRCEAAGVIAQITSPCLEHFQHLNGLIENMADLIAALTDVCSKASNGESFLLGCAALANITFMDNMACDYLSQYNTATVLLQALNTDKAQSLFAKDQIVTVLANMAAVDTCFDEITANNGIKILVDLLHERPPKSAINSELAACEHVLQKSAITLTRLCKEPINAHTTAGLNCIPRLVRLCKDPTERNNSDGVLVTCLAALRKLSSTCPDHPDTQTNAVKELIQPKMMDSFLLCSEGLDESVV